MTRALQRAHPGNIHNSHILGWLPYRPSQQVGTLAKVDQAVTASLLTEWRRMHEGLASRLQVRGSGLWLQRSGCAA
jgi:hypothetical protein